MEKFLNVKGYSKATRGMIFLSLEWNYSEGYTVFPTQKIPREGYKFLNENAVKLGEKPEKNSFNKAIVKAKELSRTF